MPPPESPATLTVSAPPAPARRRVAPDPTSPEGPLDPRGILAHILDPECHETAFSIAQQHDLTTRELAAIAHEHTEILEELTAFAHARTRYMVAHAENLAVAALAELVVLPLADATPGQQETVRRAATTIITLSKRLTGPAATPVPKPATQPTSTPPPATPGEVPPAPPHPTPIRTATVKERLGDDADVGSLTASQAQRHTPPLHSTTHPPGRMNGAAAAPGHHPEQAPARDSFKSPRPPPSPHPPRASAPSSSPSRPSR